MLRAGDFFVGPFPPGSNKKRRFLVLTDEVAHEDTIVWVYTSTSMSDQTVCLMPGCHPEIVADCCIVYEQASIVASQDIAAAVRAGALKRRRT